MCQSQPLTTYEFWHLLWGHCLAVLAWVTQESLIDSDLMGPVIYLSRWCNKFVWETRDIRLQSRMRRISFAVCSYYLMVIFSIEMARCVLSLHYGNQSRGYFNGGRPRWPPAVPRLAARPSQSNPRGSGPEVLKRERGHVTVETWSFWVGVFRALQPNVLVQERKKKIENVKLNFCT